MTQYLILVCSAICSYLLGGVNGAIILSKLLYKQDIRDFGSNNPGFTNFKRVYGNSFAAWSVILIDVFKTALPVFLTALFMQNLFGMWQFGAAFSGLFCIIGHCFPVWYQFRGGKGFMAGFAAIWFIDWRVAVAAMIIFFVLLAISRYMSFASCISSLSCPLFLLILGAPGGFWVYVCCTASALLIVIRHRENIRKLIHGTESKFSLLKK